MQTPLVTIIVPIYNAALGLVTCLESIKRQKYSNLEILLVNDGSSDSSLEICRMYARIDPRIQIIDKKNSGVSDTRNVAIRRASGKYLQFVDADDYLDENATRLMVEAMEENESDMVICHYCMVTKGERTTVFGFLPAQEHIAKEEFARHMIKESASFYYSVMWNKLYRRDLIAQHGILCSEELSWSEDLLFNLEYIRYAHRFTSLRTPLYYYTRQGRKSLSSFVNPATVLQTKAELFRYYKQLYTDLGLYDAYKLNIYGYLIATAHDMP